ncbi:MAG: hypothetical protein BAA02_01715 [Paenibacillaceae bacterium ZCTH02-B3]|nr:MAG: hypothetical protein BAA02_01715 [Paenibacillaceae bacterium ZCTH02-B3]
MSMENVRLFLQKVREDEALREKIARLGQESRENMKGVLVRLGEEAGLPFSTEDLERYQREIVAQYRAAGELDDAQLEAVAGGDWWLIFSFIPATGVLCALSAIGAVAEAAGDSHFSCVFK